MLNVAQLRHYIIKPTLNDLIMYSSDAEELLVFTCAVESEGGTYLKQVNGPALGIYQMEPKTYNDLWVNYICNKSSLTMMLISNFSAGFMPPEDRMIYDLKYATAMARIFYSRIPHPLPSANDVNAIWEYYKTYYNTLQGAAEKNSALARYYRFLNN